MYKEKDAFGLLYGNLWLVDEVKLAKATPNLEDKKCTDTVDTNNINLIKSSLSITKGDNIYNNWNELVDQIQNCVKCGLCNSRKNVVIERGSRQAKWMFVGEAPGEKEDLQGKPFVGLSGELLNKMIVAMGLNIDTEVYICNVVKCRPPSNRNPEKIEIEKCNNYLLTQINLVRPKIIVTLGKFASQTLLSTEVAVSKLRSKIHIFKGIPVITTFHPSYLLRNLPAKKDAWQDLQLALRVFKEKYENNN